MTFWFSNNEHFPHVRLAIYVTLSMPGIRLMQSAVLANTQQLMHHSGRTSMTLTWPCKVMATSVLWTRLNDYSFRLIFSSQFIIGQKLLFSQWNFDVKYIGLLLYFIIARCK